jgi:hypothetical protein
MLWLEEGEVTKQAERAVRTSAWKHDHISYQVDHKTSPTATQLSPDETMPSYHKSGSGVHLITLALVTRLPHMTKVLPI